MPSVDTVPEAVTHVEAVRALHNRSVPPPMKLGRMTDGVVASLRDAGVFGMAMPEQGGPEADPITQFGVSEALSRADASVGWIVTIASDTGFYAARLPEATAEEMFADRETITASVLVPKGITHPVEGGYRVSGHWGFSGSSLHAAWFGGNCMIVDPDAEPGGPPNIRTFFFPASEVTVTTTGTRRASRAAAATTGASRTSSYRPIERSIFEPARVDRRIYRFRGRCLNTPGVALGLARAAIDALVELAHEEDGRRRASETTARPEGARGRARPHLRRDGHDVAPTLRRPHAHPRRARSFSGHRGPRSRPVSGSSPTCTSPAAARLSTGRALDRYFRDSATISQHAFANENAFGEVHASFMASTPKSALLDARPTAPNRPA